MATIVETVLENLELDKLENISTLKESSTPELTEEKVLSVIGKLREIEKNNGYVAIAQAEGLTVGQVIEIDEKRNARISELKASD